MLRILGVLAGIGGVVLIVAQYELAGGLVLLLGALLIALANKLQKAAIARQRAAEEARRHRELVDAMSGRGSRTHSTLRKIGS